jgi:hypothetical protein
MKLEIIERHNKQNTRTVLLPEIYGEVLKQKQTTLSNIIVEVFQSYSSKAKENNFFSKRRFPRGLSGIRKIYVEKMPSQEDVVTVKISPDEKTENAYAKAINYNPSQSLKSKRSYLSKRKGGVHHSEISINPNTKVEAIPSKIIKITSQIVVIECITDIENQLYETREFPALLFKKYNYLKVGLVCNLNIALSPNNLNLTITNLNDSKIENLFDTSDLFDDLEGFENVHYH